MSEKEGYAMAKFHHYITALLLIVIASIYPLCYRFADHHATTTFSPKFLIFVTCIFPIIIALLNVFLIRGENKMIIVNILLAIISLLIGYYLYIYCPYTYGIFPVYNIFAASTLLFSLKKAS